MRYALSLSLSLALLVPAAAHAQIVSGPAVAIDGDSLDMSGTRIRLHGIDAPEGRQTCRRDGATWNCGQDAAVVLRSLVAGKTVTCEARDTDGHGRTVATCHAGSVDLAGAMISAGLAVALPKFSDAYVESEGRVRRLRVGIWGSEFEMPAAYRAANPRLVSGQAQAVARPRPPASSSRRSVTSSSGACLIKGNHSRRGDWIYHLPGMPYYNATRPEAMFCTEAQAVAAGYRRAIVK